MKRTHYQATVIIDYGDGTPNFNWTAPVKYSLNTAREAGFDVLRSARLGKWSLDHVSVSTGGYVLTIPLTNDNNSRITATVAIRDVTGEPPKKEGNA